MYLHARSIEMKHAIIILMVSRLTAFTEENIWSWVIQAKKVGLPMWSLVF